MEYRKLGQSGLKVSAIGIGTNQFGGKVDLQTTKEIIHRAFDLGVNFIDTADVYTGGRSEEFLGQALKGNWERVVLATKVGEDQGASRYHITRAVEASLRRLDHDHIDLYQIHFWDPDTPIEETMRTLDDLIRSGKVRYIGASNFTAWQLCWANGVAEMMHLTPFVSIQPHYNILQREIEAELVPYAQAFNIGILPYRPLAGGFLTGKYTRDRVPPGSRGESNARVQSQFTEENYALVDKLTQFARNRGHTMTELAIAWLLAQPQISSVIAGVTSVDQLEQNVKANGWHLTPDEEAEICSILEGR